MEQTARPDDRRRDRARSRKVAALDILAPLGFVDAEDADAPGVIRHPDTGVRIDTETTAPRNVVAAILAHGEGRARDAIRTKLSTAVDALGV